jgi:hypothetical protein
MRPRKRSSFRTKFCEAGGEFALTGSKVSVRAEKATLTSQRTREVSGGFLLVELKASVGTERAALASTVMSAEGDIPLLAGW